MSDEPRSNFERLALRFFKQAMDRLSTDYSVDYKRYNSGTLEFRTSNLTVPYIKPFLRLGLYGEATSTLIEHLEVCPSYRNKGLASAALRALCKAADRCSQRLTLFVSPYPVPGLEDTAPHSASYLREFYERRDFAVDPFAVCSGIMARQPSTLGVRDSALPSAKRAQGSVVHV